ncbi:hypothetical protein LCGC14_0264730 [marine sediment metagenome]|uniref:Uncharacterized protein n=1 Tax=marine sediment metagenome TaxID=412755 RepID=A0A0F9U109_9ZZZZ
MDNSNKDLLDASDATESDVTEEAIVGILQELFPHGDSLFLDLTLSELKGYSAKNYDYAAGGDANGNFFRVSSILGLYPGLKLSDPRVVAFVYLMKQVDNVLWSFSRGFEGKVEDIDPRLFDVGVYVKIIRILHQRLKEKENQSGEWGDPPVSGRLSCAKPNLSNVPHSEVDRPCAECIEILDADPSWSCNTCGFTMLDIREYLGDSE